MNTIERLKAMQDDEKVLGQLNGEPIEVYRRLDTWTVWTIHIIRSVHIESIDEETETLSLWTLFCQVTMHAKIPATYLILE